MTAMADDPNDTLTNFEAKLLCLRYGIKDIDANNCVEKLRKFLLTQSSSGTSLKSIAKQLGEDKNSLKASEINALRKLKLTN